MLLWRPIILIKRKGLIVKEYIMNLITTYGIEVVLLALLINILTGLIKLPIKKMATKLNDSNKVTRFIVFLPILLGFGVTYLYYYLFMTSFEFDNSFITLWVTSTSFSLTFYAVFEKMFPSKKNIEKNCEIQTTRKILNLIEEFLKDISNKENINDEELSKKIILKRKKG